MVPALTALAVVVGLGVALGLPAYSRLFQILRLRHPATWEEIGKPKMIMASPSRSIGLQKFLFSSKGLELGDKELNSLIKFLRLFTATLIITVAIAIAMVIYALLGNSG